MVPSIMQVFVDEDLMNLLLFGISTFSHTEDMQEQCQMFPINHQDQGACLMGVGVMLVMR